MKHIISLGAGVQSSTMALMAAHGELTPMPDCAVFADTGAEPQKVYEWLSWLEAKLPFPVHRVMHKDGLLADIMRKQAAAGAPRERFVSAPFFTLHGGKAGMTRRQCTREFKIQPIERFVRRTLLGLGHGERGPKEIVITQWIGISTDEMQRMKESRLGFVRHRFPLIDDVPMSRSQCLLWMQSKGYPLPSKSSCTFCPYHDDALWRDMKLNDPQAWGQAVEVDRHLRSGTAAVAEGLDSSLYVHRSCKPLEQVDLRNAADHGQLDMFAEECDGMCGV